MWSCGATLIDQPGKPERPADGRQRQPRALGEGVAIDRLNHPRGLHIPAEAVKVITQRVHRDYVTAERVVEAIDRHAFAERARLTLPTIRRALGSAGIIDQRGAA